MVKGTYMVWTRDLESGIRAKWHPLRGGLSEDDAQKEIDIGNERAQRFSTYIKYIACAHGIDPNGK